MSICINKNGDIFEDFIKISENDVIKENLDFPLTHSLIVVKNDIGFLLMYNKWELAGGIIDNNETIRECAERELLEETNQKAENVEFVGLMKFKLKNGKTEYGGLFKGNIIKEMQFLENNESEKIIFWNGKDNIGYIDEIDQKLLEYY